MAKHVILESYTFTPSTNTIVVTGKNIRREQLLLITNVTRGTVIYNFSDPTLGASSYTNGVNSVTGLETTTIVTSYSTSAMATTDKLSILVEETYNETAPAETFMDPVGKMRVSQPQSLIDTDFEYGTQPTKWESITLLNNRPSAFYDVTQPVNINTSITNITSSSTTVTVTGTGFALTVGQPIFVTGSLDQANADGWWVVDTVTSTTSFTYKTFTAPTQVGGTLFDGTKSYVYAGTFYTGAAIPATSIVTDGTKATVTTTNAHGLAVGNHVFIVGATTTTAINGTWQVATTPTNNTFTITTTVNGTVGNVGASTLYVRAQGYVLHRAFDGGVQFTNQLPYHGYQVVRQTRRYFRYQSGKGIQFSTGSILKPAANVDTISASGTTITVTCKYPHGLAAGSQVQVSGCNETAYNGIFTVVTAATPLTFTYTALTTPSATPATPSNGALFTVSPYAWYGSRNRIGMFDQQNGFFYEFDGQTLWAVKRSSTTQISGVVGITTATTTVTGTNTAFSKQLVPGDWVVIRGMSYTVTSIVSDTSMQIYPEYRGATIANSVVSKTIDQKYPQSQWNIDKMDGTGHSLYNIDLTKMQMFYCDFTWYGAGAVRFGFKNNRGEVIYCHRIPNNNVNTEAYMRSGNLPARYETNTFSYYTFLTATLASAATTGATISGADFSNWPNSGTAILTASGATGAAIEYISYSAKTQTASLTGTLTNGSTTITMTSTTGVAVGQYISGTGIQPNSTVLAVVTNSSITISQPVTVTGPQTILFAPQLVIAARAQTGGAVASTFTYSATAPIQISFYSPSQASTISHWGSSVIMDGRFDDDKSYVFQAGMTSTISNVAQNASPALISLRLAPSVDSGLTGLLGAREILNRMQLTLRQMDCLTTGTGAYFLIKLILNGRVSTATGNNWQPVGGSSLSQVCYHAASTTISGGETIFSFYTNAAAVTQQDLILVRDLGTSILSGGGSTLATSTTPNNIYPDGPDVITITATNVTAVSTNSIQARISWTEAQA